MAATNVMIWLMLGILLLVPVLCLVTEYFLAKRHPKGGLIFPLAVMCLFFWLGIYALVLGGILFAVYFVVRELQRREEENRREGEEQLDRMNIHDL